MKLPFIRCRHGAAFTLVELLVVIGIIAILASVVSVAAGSAIAYAKRTRAQSSAVQIQTAVQGYYTEYGVYPTPSGSSTGDAYYSGTDVADWQNMMYALCGNINPLTGQSVTTGTISNTRSIPFLSPTRSDLNSTTGIIQSPFGSSATSLYFYLAIDTDYSGVVGDSAPALGNMPDFTKYPTNYMGTTLASGTPGGVAVWSPNNEPLVGTSSKPSPANFWAHTY